MEAEPTDTRIAIDAGTATEKVRALADVYIPWCLTSSLLAGGRSPREAWGILRCRSKHLWIPEAFSPMLEWLRVRLLTDYMGDLDRRIDHLLPPPHKSQSSQSSYFKNSNKRYPHLSTRQQSQMRSPPSKKQCTSDPCPLPQMIKSGRHCDRKFPAGHPHTTRGGPA